MITSTVRRGMAAVDTMTILKGIGCEMRTEMRRGFVAHARCPRCGGSIFLDNDYDSWFEQCLQCGYTHYLDKIIKRTMLLPPNPAVLECQSKLN